MDVVGLFKVQKHNIVKTYFTVSPLTGTSFRDIGYNKKVSTVQVQLSYTVVYCYHCILRVHRIRFSHENVDFRLPSFLFHSLAGQGEKFVMHITQFTRQNCFAEAAKIQ